MDLIDKTALVTGGANGIGRLLVERLARGKAKVAVFDIDRKGIEELAAALPGVSVFPCDIGDPAAVRAGVGRVVESLGAIHLLVNNAAAITNGPLVRFGPDGIQKHDFALWDTTVRINLSGVFYVSACVAEGMARARTKGVIINVSSVCASGNPGQGAYSATKAGVRALTAAWAKELGPLGIRVAGIAPGYTDTAQTRASVADQALNDIIDRVPLRRLGTPDEIVEAILFIVKNNFVHGKTLDVDGGLVV